jgi:hypothetical protein
MRERIGQAEATKLAAEFAERKPVPLQPAMENQQPPASRLLPPRKNHTQQRKAPPCIRSRSIKQ